MIELTSRSGAAPARNIAIIGIGGAGANALDRMALDGIEPGRLIAAHTDAQVLAASVAGRKIQLGQTVARGLGSGGDPEVGRGAAEESAAELRAALEGTDTVFVLAGLGGGTGSGAAPFVAELAREAGALVIAIVTLPFSFEGKRRGTQAAEALAALQEQADAILCFENDRMGDMVPPRAGIQAAFTATDETLSQSVRALSGLLGRSGLIHLGFDDLAAALRDVSPRSLFGYGEAEGGNRAFDALGQALKNPFMDKGRLLRDCETVLVQVSGGPDLTLDEVQLLMEELNRSLSDNARLLFGTAVAPELKGRLTVTILSSLGDPQPAAAPRPRPVAVRAPVAPVAAVPVPAAPVEPEEEFEPKAELEPEPEPELEPEAAVEPGPEQTPLIRIRKPRGLRVAAQQASLFGEEVSAPIERVVPPVPGRMLNRPFPEPFAPEPEPEEAPEAADVSAALEEPEAGEPAVVEDTLEASPELLSVPEVEPEPPTPEPGQEVPAAPVFRGPYRRPERRLPLRSLQQQPEQMPEPPIPAKPAASGKAPLQEMMQFEPVTRGRFEKSEPTIVDGQDLDVPAYLRHRVKLK